MVGLEEKDLWDQGQDQLVSFSPWLCPGAVPSPSISLCTAALCTPGGSHTPKALHTPRGVTLTKSTLHMWRCHTPKHFAHPEVPHTAGGTTHTQRCRAKSSEHPSFTSGQSCFSCNAFAHKDSLTNELLMIINKL